MSQPLGVFHFPLVFFLPLLGVDNGEGYGRFFFRGNSSAQLTQGAMKSAVRAQVSKSPNSRSIMAWYLPPPPPTTHPPKYLKDILSNGLLSSPSRRSSCDWFFPQGDVIRWRKRLYYCLSGTDRPFLTSCPSHGDSTLAAPVGDYCRGSLSLLAPLVFPPHLFPLTVHAFCFMAIFLPSLSSEAKLCRSRFSPSPVTRKFLLYPLFPFFFCCF